MDRASWLGVLLGISVLIGGLYLKGANPAALLNPAALIIIFLGTAASIFIAFPMNEVKKIPTLFRIIFSKPKIMSEKELLVLFSEWANINRRSGLLALEDKEEEIEDEFLKRGLRMIVDGEPKELIQEVLEEDIQAMVDRHAVGGNIFTQAGTYAPTLGVLGAVVGLVAALGDLDDMELLGKSIAAAFIATLFGIFTGYVLWHPFSNKLKRKSKQEERIKYIMLEGLLAIHDGVSPRIIEEKMLSYLSVKERKQLLEEEEEEDQQGKKIGRREGVASNG